MIVFVMSVIIEVKVEEFSPIISISININNSGLMSVFEPSWYLNCPLPKQTIFEVKHSFIIFLFKSFNLTV